MEESVLDFLKREVDSTPVLCQMQHPDPAKPGHQATPCTRTAAYAATIHDCEQSAKHPGAGVKVPVCAHFLERAKRLNYPYRCSGCNSIIGHFVHLIWDIEHLTPTTPA